MEGNDRLTSEQVIPMVFYGLINMAAWGLEMLGLIPKEKPIA
jgi:hypothetical protein